MTARSAGGMTEGVDTPSLRTALVEVLDISMPIIAAPMAGVSGSELAAAVASSGGLGLLGAGFWSVETMKDQYNKAIDLLKPGANRKHCAVGLGLMNFTMSSEVADAVLSLEPRPRAVWLSFGSFEPWLSTFQDAGIPVLAQVQTLEQVQEVAPLKPAAIVVQSTDAGGHGTSSSYSTFAMLPQACLLAHPVPVVAAGGVASGRHLAGALVLGAAGVAIGTLLQVSEESAAPAELKAKLLHAAGASSCGTDAGQLRSMRTLVYDHVTGVPWPEGVDGRCLENAFVKKYHPLCGTTPREEVDPELLQQMREEVQDAKAAKDYDTCQVWAGASVGMVPAARPADHLLRQMLSDARAALLAGAAAVAAPGEASG